MTMKKQWVAVLLLCAVLREQVWQNQNTLSSMYQSLQKSIQKSLETINKAYSEE